MDQFINPPEQQVLFNENDIGTINFYNDQKGSDSEKKRTTNLSEDDDRWCESVASAISTTTGNHKYGASSVVREAVKFYRAFYSVRHKLWHSKKKVMKFVSDYL